MGDVATKKLVPVTEAKPTTITATITIKTTAPAGIPLILDIPGSATTDPVKYTTITLVPTPKDTSIASIAILPVVVLIEAEFIVVDSVDGEYARFTLRQTVPSRAVSTRVELSQPPVLGGPFTIPVKDTSSLGDSSSEVKSITYPASSNVTTVENFVTSSDSIPVSTTSISKTLISSLFQVQSTQKARTSSAPGKNTITTPPHENTTQIPPTVFIAFAAVTMLCLAVVLRFVRSKRAKEAGCRTRNERISVEEQHRRAQETARGASVLYDGGILTADEFASAVAKGEHEMREFHARSVARLREEARNQERNEAGGVAQKTSQAFGYEGQFDYF